MKKETMFSRRGKGLLSTSVINMYNSGWDFIREVTKLFPVHFFSIAHSENLSWAVPTEYESTARDWKQINFRMPSKIITNLVIYQLIYLESKKRSIFFSFQISHKTLQRIFHMKHIFFFER